MKKKQKYPWKIKYKVILVQIIFGILLNKSIKHKKALREQKKLFVIKIKLCENGILTGECSANFSGVLNLKNRMKEILFLSS